MWLCNKLIVLYYGIDRFSDQLSDIS